MARPARGRYATQVAVPPSVREGGVLRPELAGQGMSFDHLLDRWFDAAQGRDFATQMMLVDLQSYLPGDILTKVDRASMASSLEARVPLLDHVLVEFAVQLPSALKLRDGEGKWILRRAIEGMVPAAVLSHPKRGFAVPLVHWLRRELAHRLDALVAPGRPVHAYADEDAVRRLVREHRTRRRDNSLMLWRLLVLDVWLECLRRGDLGRPAASDAVREYVAVARS
jgi:asparagine synthetase B (glutamine-hydrolysing)